MTDPVMTLQSLLAKSSDAEFLRSMIGYTAQRLMELEVEGRTGSYFPAFLEPCRAAEKALTAVIQEAYVQGGSTRSVNDLVQAMGMSGISKSQVSRPCQDIDTRVQAFLTRPLEGAWPYLWLDAPPGHLRPVPPDPNRPPTEIAVCRTSIRIARNAPLMM